MAAPKAHIGTLVVASLLAFGCTSGDGSAVGTAAPTLVTVDPASFRGDVVCGSHPGAMRTYVATLTDVSVSPPFRLPSSPPTPCELAVSFAYVVPGHSYVASIEAYDSETIAPRGGALSGSPVMIDPQSGESVAPVWSTHCGDLEDETSGVVTIARSFRNVGVRGCLPLQRLAPAEEAQISIDTTALLGELRCGTEAGEIERLRITSTDATIEAQDVDCGESLVLPSPSARMQRFDIAAFEAGADEPRWFARCHAESQAGATLPASCTRLSPKGTIHLRIDRLLEHHGLECAPDDVESFNVLVDDRMSLSGISCEDEVAIGPLDPGDYELLVVALGRSEVGLVSKLMTRCPTVTVEGGRSVETSCLP